MFPAGAGSLKIWPERASMDTKNPISSAAAKTFPPAASNGTHRQQQVAHAQGASPSPLPRGRRGG
jgi:hypothetical protein